MGIWWCPKMIPKRKLFSFNFPWEIHHKSLRHCFKYMYKWRRGVIVENKTWWICRKNKNYTYLIFFKKVFNPKVFLNFIQLKMSGFVSIAQITDFQSPHSSDKNESKSQCRMTTSWWDRHLPPAHHLPICSSTGHREQCNSEED